MPKSTKKKAGRPAIKFDLSVVEGLGRIGATINDMVHVLPRRSARSPTAWPIPRAISASPLKRGGRC
jgi:hypothetical protein